MSMLSIFFDGVEEETKVCSICKENLPTWKFGKASGGNYLRGECRECSKKLGESREKARKMAPTIPEDHVCPICQRKEEEVKNRGGKKSGTWCCDHDHETGKYRGYLCHDCNRGIGNLGDDPDRLRRAAEYIEGSK